MFGLRFVQGAVSVPLISSPPSALEAQQLENLVHRDFMAKLAEVDARHVGSILVEKKETVPFPLSIWGTGTACLKRLRVVK